MAKQRVARRSSLERSGIRRLGSKEDGFWYQTFSGAPVENQAALDRIRRLRIPPAWNDVRIAPSSSAALQAIGVDRRGRTQYLYHAAFRQKREQEKFLRVVEFGESLPHLRRRVAADLRKSGLGRDRVIAAIVRLMDQAFFRVGNDKSARTDETYGLTTVRTDHVSVRGSEIHFDFVGKWRKNHRALIQDEKVAALIRSLRPVKGDELFKFFQGPRLVDVKDRHVNEYIQAVIGEKFTAKDFRTWAGTLLCSIELGKGQAPTKKGRKRLMKTAIEVTARQLGNTPAVCRASYICPRLLDEFMEGKEFEAAHTPPRSRPVARQGLSPQEQALLKFLRETIADRRKRPR